MAIPTPIVRNLEQEGFVRTMAIDLSDRPEDRAAVIEVLRSKLYADKILAPIREYSTNAMDAHVEAGIPDRPIRVTLPSIISPELRIRDFGTGLNPDEVEAIYIKYGRSTKRTTNAQTGQLGLGCKSAFAYGDNFVVISYNNGVQTSYNLTINGVCTILASEPTTEPSGMEIIVPVNVSDVQEFQKKCVTFFEYWKVVPVIVGGDADFHDKFSKRDTSKPIFEGNGWEIRPATDYYHRGEGRVIMGNIPYPIDFGIISSKMNVSSHSTSDRNEILFEFVKSNKTLLWFGVGELDFSASRESLEYTEKTVKAVVAKIKEITSSVFDILSQKISEAKTYWEAMLIYNKIFGSGDEKIFSGDMSRLEGVYRGRFKWNEIVINAGGFQHLDKWDVVLGYYENKKWSLGQDNGDNRCPVLTTYTENHNGRLRRHSPNDYSHNYIGASENVCIIINDSEKPVAPDTVARWAMNRDAGTAKKPAKVYHLKFRDAAQEADFFSKLNFESAPYIRVSHKYDEIKKWLKAQRASSGNGQAAKGMSRLPTRCFTPANRKGSYGYWNSSSWGRKDIDIYEEMGYYVELDGESVVINGNPLYDLAPTVHHSHVLFTALGETTENVYAFPKKNREAKWFGEAVEEGQWTKLEEYFKSKKNRILAGKEEEIAKSASYYKAVSDGSCIGIGFAAKLLPLLKYKTGAMYRICSEITADFKKDRDLIESMEHFGINVSLTHAGIDFVKATEEVKTVYSLLPLLDDSRYVFSNGDAPNDEFVKKVAAYVNMVDKENNSGV